MLQNGRRASINSTGSGSVAAPPGDTLVEHGSTGQGPHIGNGDWDSRSSGTTAAVSAIGELNSLFRGYVTSCRNRTVTEIPPAFKSKRVTVRIAVRYNKWVTLICLISSVAFGLCSAKEEGVSSFKDFFRLLGNRGPAGIALQVSFSIFVISCLLLIALEIIDTVLSVTERKARDHQLVQLREHVRSACSVRQNVDAKAAYFFESLIASYDKVFTDVHRLKESVLEEAQTRQTIQQQHTDLLTEIASLRQFVKEQVSKAMDAERGSATIIEEHTRLVQERLRSAEEKAEKAFAENCSRVIESLKKAQDLSRQRASELKNLLSNFKEVIATMLEKSADTTARSTERIMQAHQYWMSTTSKIVSVEGAASVSMCVFFLKTYSHIKDVSDIKDLVQTAVETSKLRQILTSTKDAIQRMRSDVNPRNRVAAISRIFQKELAPVVDKQEELEAALNANTNLERYDELCRPVVKNCYEALFGTEKGIFKTADSYKTFLQSLYAVRADDDISKLEGECVTLNQLRDVTPFLMVMRLILRIAMNIESVHDLSGKIHAITGQSDIDLEKVFRGVWESGKDVTVLKDTKVEEVPVVPETGLDSASGSRNAS